MCALREYYLDTREAAAWLGLSPKTLERYRVSGEGPDFHKSRRPGSLPARRPGSVGLGAAVDIHVRGESAPGEGRER